MRKVALVVTALLSLSSCAADGPKKGNASNDAQMAPLEDDALRLLLSDVSVSLPRTGGATVSHFWGEVFDKRGVYFKVEGRRLLEGTFEIKDGSVCVHGHGIDPNCRHVFANPDGSYKFVNLADGSSNTFVVAPRP